MSQVRAAVSPVSHASGRDRILAAARCAFSARGYDGVSMQDVADAAHMTKAALYYHFRDKDELFGAVVPLALQDLAARIDRADAAGGALDARIERVALALLEADAPQLGRLLLDGSRLDATGAPVVPPAAMDAPRAAVRRLLAAAMARGEIRPLDLDMTASLLLAILLGQVRRIASRAQAPPADVAARAVADLMVHGLANTQSIDGGGTAAASNQHEPNDETN